MSSVMHFGERLRLAMALSGRTKADVAHRTGRSKSTIYRWLTLATHPELHDYRVIWELADYLNTSARHLWTGHGTPIRQPRLAGAEVEWLERYRTLTQAQRDRFVTTLTKPPRRRRRA